MCTRKILLLLTGMIGLANTPHTTGMDNKRKQSRTQPFRPKPLTLPKRSIPVVEIGEYEEERISSPLLAKHTFQFDANNTFPALQVTCCTLTNRGIRHILEKTPLEDRHAIQTAEHLPTHLFCGVFDGHNGYRAAEIAAKEIPQELTQQLAVDKLQTDTVEQALCDSFLKTEKKIAIDDGGTTATIAYLWPNTEKNNYVISVANAGDSRTLISNVDGTMLLETHDHKATDPKEEQRVTDAGGVVLRNRLFGTLSVTRSIGDLAHKGGNCCSPTSLIALPETNTLAINNNCFIIQASDGLWDHESSDNATALVANELARSTSSQAGLENAAQLLYKRACNGNDAPLDDVTIVISFIERTNTAL